MSSKKALPRILFTVLGVGLVTGAGYWYWQSKDAVRPPELNSVQVSRGDIVMVVTATGDIEPVNTVEVSSQVSGLISEVLVDWNTQVKQGDVLARLDPATYEQKLKQANADLASANASYTLQKLSTDRTSALFAKGLATVQERDQALALLAQAEANLQTKQAAVENAKVDLSRCTVYAPMDGIVMQRAADVGKTVAASLNAPTLFIIADKLARMEIVAAVAEADIGNVAEGQAVNFRVDAYPNRQFKGKVVQIRNYPKTTSNVVTYDTIIEVNNEDLKLKPGMTANAEIIVAERHNVLKITNSALRVRMPEELIVHKGTEMKEASAAPAKVVSNEERRRIMGEIFQQVGYSRESGNPPSPEMITRMQQLAKERGIEFDPSRLTRGSNRSSDSRSGTDTAPVQRTLYRVLASEAKMPQVEAVSTKLGISDSMNTEIIEGLQENDSIVTSVVSSNGSAASGSANPMNPFGGNRGPGAQGGPRR